MCSLFENLFDSPPPPTVPIKIFSLNASTAHARVVKHCLLYLKFFFLTVTFELSL